MAGIGMRYPVAAKVNSHTDGSAISYDTGFVIGNAVDANLNIEYVDNPDHGDDIVIDNDNGVLGYNGTLDTNDLSATVRGKLLGWVAMGTTTTTTHYQVGGTSSPEMGWGFIKAGMIKGVRYFDAYWFHKSQFSLRNVRASTKARQIEWNHPQMTVTGLGAYIDSSGDPKFFDWMRFDTETAAKAWLNGKAGIT